VEVQLRLHGVAGIATENFRRNKQIFCQIYLPQPSVARAGVLQDVNRIVILIGVPTSAIFKLNDATKNSLFKKRKIHTCFKRFRDQWRVRSKRQSNNNWFVLSGNHVEQQTKFYVFSLDDLFVYLGGGGADFERGVDLLDDCWTTCVSSCATSAPLTLSTMTDVSQFGGEAAPGT
jgi:hypothetical protein